MSHKGTVVGLLIFGLILCALIFRSRDLAVMAMPLLTYLGVGLFLRPGGVRLRAERHIDTTNVSALSPVEVWVTVTNEGTALSNLNLVERLQPGMKWVEGCLEQRISLQTGDTATLRYVFQAGRGRYAWESLHAVVSDPLSLFPQDTEIQASNGVLVLPELLKLQHVPLLPQDTLHSAGPVPARMGGPGIDFWGVRKYLPGDSLRHIHWRLSARYPNQYFSKEFERQEIMDVGLILDARQLGEQSGMTGDFFECAASATVSLAERFLHEGNRVSLLTCGQKISRLFPGFGKVQLNRIMHNVAKTEPGPNFPLDSLKYLSVRLFPSHSQIIIISPLAHGDWQFFQRLKAYEYSILVVSPNPVEFAVRQDHSSGTDGLAIRAARVERRMLLSRLLRMGIPVVDWRVDQPLSQALQRGLSFPVARNERRI